MATTTPRMDSAQLRSLADRLKAWRATRIGRQRIPEKFWAAAAELAGVHGLNRTAAALKLNYYGLRRRLPGNPAQRKRGVRHPAFVELAPPVLASSLDQQGTIELIQASGTRLTLRLPNASPQDLLPVVEVFLGCRA